MIDWQATAKDHQAAVGFLDSIQGHAGHAAVEEAVARDAIEQYAGAGLLHADVDAAGIGIVHAQEADEQAARVDDGDVLRYADGRGRRAGSGDDGGGLVGVDVVTLHGCRADAIECGLCKGDGDEGQGREERANEVHLVMMAYSCTNLRV